MRITTILARILALKQTRVLAVHLEPEGVLLDVSPTTRVPFCSGCLKRVRAVVAGVRKQVRVCTACLRSGKIRKAA